MTVDRPTDSPCDFRGLLLVVPVILSKICVKPALAGRWRLGGETVFSDWDLIAERLEKVDDMGFIAHDSDLLPGGELPVCEKRGQAVCLG